MIYFQYYPAHVNSNRPTGTVSLEEFIESIRNPSQKIIDVFSQISAAAAEGDMKLKDDLKQNNLFYFTPCVYIHNGYPRKYLYIGFFTGLAVMDFDKLDNAPALKKFIFDNYKFVICAYLSPSKKGVKFLVKIPVATTVDEFKSFYYGLGLVFEKFKGWDGTAQNAVLPLFLSYDPDILYRNDADTFTTQGQKLNAFKATETAAITIETDDSKKGQVLEKCRKAFEIITDNGHPQVRAAGVALGGYVASGYITHIEAEQFIEQCIRSTPYLQKGIPGYITTARTAIQKGTSSQLFL